jgi:hypothetical protein
MMYVQTASRAQTCSGPACIRTRPVIKPQAVIPQQAPLQYIAPQQSQQYAPQVPPNYYGGQVMTNPQYQYQPNPQYAPQPGLQYIPQQPQYAPQQLQYAPQQVYYQCSTRSLSCVVANPGACGCTDTNSGYTEYGATN